MRLNSFNRIAPSLAACTLPHTSSAALTIKIRHILFISEQPVEEAGNKTGLLPRTEQALALEFDAGIGDARGDDRVVGIDIHRPHTPFDGDILGLVVQLDALLTAD